MDYRDNVMIQKLPCWVFEANFYSGRSNSPQDLQPMANEMIDTIDLQDEEDYTQ